MKRLFVRILDTVITCRDSSIHLGTAFRPRPAHLAVYGASRPPTDRATVNSATARIHTKKPKSATDPNLAAALQGAALQQAVAGRAMYMRSPLAAALAARGLTAQQLQGLQMPTLQGFQGLQGLQGIAALPAGAALPQAFSYLPVGLSAAGAAQGLFLQAQGAQGAQATYDPSMFADPARLQLAQAQAASQQLQAVAGAQQAANNMQAAMSAAVARATAAGATQPTWAATTYPSAQLTDPYLGTTLTAALPGYPLAYRTINRFTPY
uniref:Uncharacterized protein n=1 Tax=Plectus sambesii TaxID=2011161 RepID=A0A914URU9_9BILA